jgi:hypothetical protein
MMKPFRAPRKAKELAKPPERESEAPTVLGGVRERHIIKETEEEVANRRGGYELLANVHDDNETCEESETRMDKEDMACGGSKRATAEEKNVLHASSKVNSPCLSEFEAFLDEIDAQSKHQCKNDRNNEASCGEDEGTKPVSALTSRQRTDAWWESVLQSEKRSARKTCQRALWL